MGGSENYSGSGEILNEILTYKRIHFFGRTEYTLLVFRPAMNESRGAITARLSDH